MRVLTVPGLKYAVKLYPFLKWNNRAGDFFDFFKKKKENKLFI